MKKVLKFMKRYSKQILITIAVITALIAGFNILHSIATAERGYEAIGGEMFVFAIPFLAYAIHRNIKDTKEAIENERE